MSSQSGTCGIRRETFVFLGCLSVVLRCSLPEQPSRVGVEQLTELTISMQNLAFGYPSYPRKGDQDDKF
jgi:hypothetical protein